MSETILDHPGVQQVLFHPRKGCGVRTFGVYPVHIEVAPEIEVAGRLYSAQPEAPLLLYYHGNGEIADDYDDISNLYTQLGISLLVMDYRGYGASDGTPTADNLVGDAMLVFQELGRVCDEHDLRPQALFVMGRSLGSVPAIELARQVGDQLGGLIIESGFSDTFGLLARMGVRAQGADEEQHGFGNAIKMRQVTTRTLILHGQGDILIPPSDGQELHANCATSDKRLVLIPGAGHNDIMLVGMQEYFAAVRDFVFAEPED